MSSLRLIIAVDGTTNTSGGAFDAVAGTINGAVTSVKRIHDMVHNGTVRGTSFEQCSHYFQGVGTTGTNEDLDIGRVHLIVRARAMFDGATGSGFVDVLRSAYKVCCQNVASPNDEIWMFGYSRGAFIVRALASLLEHVGLIKPEEMITEEAFRRRFTDQLQRYSMLTSVGKIVSIRREFLLPFAVESPPVRFLGAFDSVNAAFPLPLSNTLTHGVPFLDFAQDAPRLVQHFRHALALNEQRAHFRPTRWTTPADATNPGAQYTEAWFLGFHGDIGGGGSRERGVSVWPLQWMLGCATELGLTLADPGDELFPGPVHFVAGITMHDLLPRLGASPFRPVLHAASPRLQLTPRDFRSTPTTPAVREFVHPSAYLLFNTSPALRAQLSAWRHLRQFTASHARALLRGAPWWEARAAAAQLHGVVAVRALRVLVFGGARSGKSALLEGAFGRFETRRGDGDGTVAEYRGGAVACETDAVGCAERYVAEHLQKNEVHEQLHAIWFCVDLMNGPVTDADRRFAAIPVGGIPVLVVLTRADEKRALIRDELVAAGAAAGDEAVEARLEELICATQAELAKLADRCFVPVDSTPESILALLTATHAQLPDARVQAAAVRAQRASARLKLSLATDVATHAYAVWRAFAFDGTPHVFQAGGGETADELPHALMHAVLEAFNMRVPRDAEIVRARLGAGWADALRAFPGTLWDRGVPAAALLCCCLDTMVVVARAMERRGDVTPGGVEAACAWYKLRQAGVHSRVAALLAPDGAPRDGSVAALQVGFAEAVEAALGTGEWAVQDAAVGAGRAAVGGVAAGVRGAVTVASGIVWGVGNELRRGLLG